MRRFLNELCSNNEAKLIPQTRPQNKNITSCYTIVNYNTYQDSKTTDKTTDRPQTDHKQDQNKNVKNEKNEKNKTKAVHLSELSNGEFKENIKNIRSAIKNIK